MKVLRRAFALVLCLVLLAGLFAGCGKKENRKITVSEVTHSVFYAPQYVAINKGFFEEEGLELELINGQGADKVMTAVISGHVDIGFAGPEASIYIYNEGREDYAQVFAQVTQRDGSFLVGRAPEENFDWASLKGTHVLPGRKGGVPYMAFEYVIRQNGLIPGQDVNLDDSIQFATMAAAFVAGTGDYVTIFEPTATEMEKQGQGYIVAAVGDEAGEIPYTAYFANKSYIEENPKVIQSFVNALYKGQKWVMEHDSREVAEALQPSFPDTDLDILQTVVERYRDIGAWSETPVMKQSAFDRLQTVMETAGELEQKAPFDKVINNSFAEKAAA